MAGIQISSLPQAGTLQGNELIVVQQNGVTKQSNINAANATPLAAAQAALTAANSAATDAATALSTANSAASAAATKVASVTGDLVGGTSINPTVNLPYKAYTIVATTTGGAQVFNIDATLQNNIGNIVWSYDSTGFWKGTLSGLCTGTKTTGYMLNNASGTLVSLYKIDNDTIGINATDSSFSQTDNAFYGAIIEIRKYN